MPRARVGLGLALAAIATLADCMACLDTRHRHQLTDLRDQVDSLKQLVEHMRRQLHLHELAINYLERESQSVRPYTPTIVTITVAKPKTLNVFKRG